MFIDTSQIITLVLFIAGSLWGSFLNVCIYRIPRENFWAHQRSVCPSCGSQIPMWLNIPLISYFFLRGKAKCCHKPISFIYPLVEFMTGVFFVLIYLKFPFFNQRLNSIDGHECIRFFHMIVFSCLLIVCSFIDFQHKIIPDKISLPMILLTPVVAYLHPELDGKSAFFGVLWGGGIIYAIAWIYYLLRRVEGIGMGDAKLLAAIGGWLGYQAILPVLFYGSVLGSLIGSILLVIKKQYSLRAEVPFGPFLALGAFLHMMIKIPLEELLLYLKFW